MTIKAKLIANLLLTSAIICIICLGGYSSLRFIQEKLFYISEKSTPYQMRTVEFERELQICITNLLKVNAAKNIEDFKRFRTDALNSVSNVKRAQQGLEALRRDGKRLQVADEFSQIGQEILSASEARISNENAAIAANEKVAKLLQESSGSLKQLETNIMQLKTARAAAFATALENTNQYSTRLRGIEELRNQVKELQSVCSALSGTTSKTTFLIARGKINSLLGRITKNRHSEFVASDIKMLTEDVRELLELQADAVTKKDASSRQWSLDSLKELLELSNRLQLTLNQEIELLSARVTNETKREGILFAESNRANDILLANSELVTMELTVAARINRLFSITSEAELEMRASELRTLFTDIHLRAKNLEHTLATFEDTDAQLLHQAHTSLETLRAELFSRSGIIATLKNKLDSTEQANRSADKLHTIATAQTSKGIETVSNARIEQEHSIAAVNSMIRKNLSSIALWGVIAVAIGIAFGIWILRSVLIPLRIIHQAIRTQKVRGKEKTALAEAVAAGNLDLDGATGTPIELDRTVLQIKHDEFGEVLQELVGMSESQVTLDNAFVDMTAALRATRDEDARRDRLKSGLYELNKILRTEENISEMANRCLSFLAGHLGAGVGIMYRFDDASTMLHSIAAYAVTKSDRLNRGVSLGEGLAGQVALERKAIILKSVPAGYLPIVSAVGEADPLHVTIKPIMHNETLIGVLELGSFKQFSDADNEFLNQSLEGIAIAISVSRSRHLVNNLLEQTQIQAEELRVQQEELQQSNEELLERARMADLNNPSDPSGQSATKHGISK
ncbi:MAG: GAF domain-containing protein [Pelobacteraceae bacterium]